MKNYNFLTIKKVGNNDFSNNNLIGSCSNSKSESFQKSPQIIRNNKTTSLIQDNLSIKTVEATDYVFSCPISIVDFKSSEQNENMLVEGLNMTSSNFFNFEDHRISTEISAKVLNDNLEYSREIYINSLENVLNIKSDGKSDTKERKKHKEHHLNVKSNNFYTNDLEKPKIDALIRGMYDALEKLKSTEIKLQESEEKVKDLQKQILLKRFEKGDRVQEARDVMKDALERLKITEIKLHDTGKKLIDCELQLHSANTILKEKDSKIEMIEPLLISYQEKIESLQNRLNIELQMKDVLRENKSKRYLSNRIRKYV